MFLKQRKHRLQNASIRSIIFMYFTITALAASVFIGVSLYGRLSGQMSSALQEENHILINQLGRTMDSYLRLVMKLSDSLYYGVIKNADLSDGSINGEITLLYDNNKDNVENIALFSKEGELLESVPAARLKNNAQVADQDWFTAALEKTENLHFSMPHVQHIFDTGDSQYRWVVSVARAVEITDGPYTDQGVLLIDLRYNSLEQLFDGMNLAKGGYVYLTDSNGDLIYHPNGQLISSGLAMENNDNTAILRDGNYQEQWQGQTRVVSIKTVGYTGWKIVGVMPLDTVSLNAIKTRILIVFIIALVLFILTIINSYISSRITDPIKELEKSVNQIEEGNLETEVYTGGSYEIQHLGKSIQNMARQIKRLMDDIVAEHESKRKSEFDTLQSQINPHFLYNTLEGIRSEALIAGLDSIAEMTEALANYFRYNISRKETFVYLKDELKNICNYFKIQQHRFGDRISFEIVYHGIAEKDVQNCYIPKLILQPIVENSIYHGLEMKIGGGVIKIHISSADDKLMLTIADDGLGMTQEDLDKLNRDVDAGKTDENAAGSHNGVALQNIKRRLKLYWGKEAYMIATSTLNYGTEMHLMLPLLFTKEDYMKS